MNHQPRAEGVFSKHVARSLALVDPDLLACFADLVGGVERWPLFLYGPPGTGKTCAALALTDHVNGSWYETAGNLAHRHAAEITGRGSAVQWDRFTPSDKHGSYRLVVLDELGLRKQVSDSHYEAVHKVLDCRDGYPLIIISNIDGDGLAGLYDARIADRIMAGTQFQLTGKSRR